MRGGRLQVYDRSVFDMIPKMGSVVWENIIKTKTITEYIRKPLTTTCGSGPLLRMAGYSSPRLVTSYCVGHCSIMSEYKIFLAHRRVQ